MLYASIEILWCQTRPLTKALYNILSNKLQYIKSINLIKLKLNYNYNGANTLT